MDYRIEIKEIKVGEKIPNVCDMVSKGWYCKIVYSNETEFHCTRDKLSKITGLLNRWNREDILRGE